MDIDYSPEHQDYKRSVEGFVAQHVRPLMKRYDLDAPLSRDDAHALWNELRVHGPLQDIRSGDGGIDWEAVGILLEALAYGNASLAFMCITSLIFPTMLYDTLTEAQQSDYAYLFGGDRIISVGFSEPGAGSNPGELRTRAQRDGEEWVVTGSKLWCSGADHSDALLVSCLIDGEDGSAAGIGQLLIDREKSPYQASPIDTIGLRAHSLCEVHLDRVRVPLGARIRADSAGKAGMQLTLQKGRLQMAAIAVGIGQRALDLALAYAKERTQFGRPIAGFQLMQEMLAQMYTDVTLGRLVAAQGFKIVQQGLAAPKETSMAKAFTTEMCLRVANLGVQVHGALGLSKESEIELIVRNARMMTIPDGTTQIHTLIIGRDLTGISAMA